VILFREFAQRYREPVIRADVLWSAIAFVAQVAIGGIVAIAIGRHFGPEVKGYASLLNIGPSIIAWLCAMGIAPATMYFAARRQRSLNELLSAATVFAVAFGALAAVTGWLLLSPTIDVSEVVFALAVGLVLTVVQLLREYHGAALLGLSRVTLYARSSLVARAVGAGVLLAAVYVAPLWLFYLVIPLSLGLTNLIVVGAVFRSLKWRWHWSTDTAEQQLRFGLHSHPGDAVVVSLLRLDQFAVFWLLGPAALGLYSVGALCADFLAQAGQAAGQLFFGRVAAADDRGPYLTRLAVGASALVLLAMALPLMLLAVPIVVGLFGPGFADAVGTWRILALAGVVEGAGRVAVLSLRALGAPLRASAAHVAGLVVNVPLVLLLGPRYGIDGIAVATLAAQIVVGVVAYAVLRGAAPRHEGRRS